MLNQSAPEEVDSGNMSGGLLSII